MKLTDKKSDEELDKIFKEIMDDITITKLSKWYSMSSEENVCDFDLEEILNQNKDISIDGFENLTNSDF